jgi:prepilin-type N-terminal cleavage/methylation domain-containing protein
MLGLMQIVDPLDTSSPSGSRSGPVPRAAERGFSLMELLVVLALVTVIVAVTVPNLRRSRIRAEMLEQVNMCKQAVAIARIEAVKGRQQVVLGFVGTALYTAEGGELRAFVDADGDEVYDAGERILNTWEVSDAVEVRLDGTNPLRDLGGLGSDRGMVIRPDGVVLAGTAAAPVGQGAYRIQDQWGNVIRLTHFSGAGSVQADMLVPGTANTWDTNLRHWSY